MLNIQAGSGGGGGGGVDEPRSQTLVIFNSNMCVVVFVVAGVSIHEYLM